MEKKNANDRKPNIISKPSIVTGSLISLAAIALSIVLSIYINNYLSSRSNLEPEPELADLNFALKVNKLEQFCDGIDSNDPGSSLVLISRLEKNQQVLERFPDSCQIALDRLRVSVTPQLGKENRVLEAIQHLCKIPENSEMYLEAEVWIQHWYDSSDWGKQTKLYLNDFAKHKNFNCPAAHMIREAS